MICDSLEELLLSVKLWVCVQKMIGVVAFIKKSLKKWRDVIIIVLSGFCGHTLSDDSVHTSRHPRLESCSMCCMGELY